MMTPSELKHWLDQFDKLTNQISKNGDHQSLAVASLMLFIKASIASCAEGNERPLMNLTTFAATISRQMIDDHSRANKNAN